jgi:hypothetical protein
MTDHALDHFVDLLRIANVDLHGEWVEPGMSECRGSLLEVRGAPASDSYPCAQAPEPLRDRQADA